jgi:hypothetical protein
MLTAFRQAIVRAGRVRLVVATLVFLLAFLYRFNALGGALGGFDGDHFMYYLGAKAVAHGERPMRDFADAGLQGAWPSLTYELPALAQRVGGETLLSEAVFVVGVLAFALALLFLTAADLGGAVGGFVVACITLFAATKLYGYSKVLVFGVAAALLLHYARQPGRARAVLLAIWSAVAFLFRHDYLVYLAPCVAILMLALGSRPWRPSLDRLLVYGATLAILLAGPVYSIQHYTGLGAYLDTSRELVARESNRTTFRWPGFEPTGDGVLAFLDNEENAIAWLYYVSVAVPGLALLSLLGSPRAPNLDARQTRAVIVSLAVLALVLDRFFLRNNLAGRLGDIGAPVAILAAWLPARFHASPPWVRMCVRTIAVLVLVPTLLALSTTGGVWHELDTTGLSDGFGKIGRRVTAVTTELGALPRPDNAPFDTEPNAAEYLRLCTAPTDRVLVVADSPEILAIAGRSFAGGQPTFRPGFYTLESDQRLTLERLRRESVPVVLLDEEDSYTSHFVPQFPLIHEHVMTSYALAGELPAPAGPPVRVFTLRERPAVKPYRSTSLPCFQ